MHQTCRRVQVEHAALDFDLWFGWWSGLAAARLGFFGSAATP